MNIKNIFEYDKIIVDIFHLVTYINTKEVNEMKGRTVTMYKDELIERAQLIGALYAKNFSSTQIAKTLLRDVTEMQKHIQEKILEKKSKGYLPVLNATLTNEQLTAVKETAARIDSMTEEFLLDVIQAEKKTIVNKEASMSKVEKVIVKKEVVKAPKVQKVIQNGVTRPAKKDSSTGLVWEICDKIYGKGKLPLFTTVSDKFVEQGGNKNTCHVQYGYWYKFMGLAKPSKEKGSAK